jgi:O-antigen/teichoic acid export membrane protein
VTAELRDPPADHAPSGARRAIANSTAQLLTFVFRAVAALGVVVLVARSGGPAMLGIVQFALVLSGLLPFYFGMPTLLAREVARRPADARRWVETGLLLALSFGAVFVLLLPAGALAVGASRETVLALAVAAVGMTFDGVARVLFAAFWARERLGLETLVTGGQEAAYLAGAALMLAQGGGPVAVLAVFSASRAVGAGWAWLLVSRCVGGLPVPRSRLGSMPRTVRRCAPFAVSDTWMLTYARFDAVLLGIWKGPGALGLYQAATNLVLYFNAVPRSINRALFPRMGRAWPTRSGEFRRLRDVSLHLVAWIGVPVTIGSFLLAPRTIDFLYGPAFAPVVLAYQLLVLVIPVRMLGHTFSLALAATDRQTHRTLAVTGVALFSIAVNCVVIPRWSYLGAAATAVLCEVTLLVAYAIILRRAAGRSALLRSNALPLLAGLPLGAAILLTNGQHVLVSALAGGAVYVLAALSLAALRARGDLRPRRLLAALAAPTR